MKKNLLAVLAVLAGTWAAAANTKNLETDWYTVHYATRVSVASSTHQVTGIGFSYTIYSSSSDYTYQVMETTKTYNVKDDRSPVISTSSTKYGLGNVFINHEWDAVAVDPKIVISNLSTAATLYLEITYGSPRNER